HPKRGREALEDFQTLPHFQGALIHDCWKPYLNLSCAHSLCNAHLLRELKFIAKIYHQDWAQKLSDLLLKMNDNPAAKTLSAWEKLYNRLLTQGEQANPQPPSRLGTRGRLKKTKAQNLIARLKQYQSYVLAFLKNPAIPFTNNQAEQDLRMIKVQQ